MLPGSNKLAPDTDEAGDEDAGFKPLTAQEAEAWRRTHRQVSIWRVVGVQAVAMAMAAFCGVWLSGSAAVGWSAFYGGLSVVLPSVVMAHGMTSSRLARLMSVFPAGSLGSVVFWEGVKVLLVVVMLAMAPAVVRELSWLALLAGLVVVLKVYWLAFFLLTKARK